MTPEEQVIEDARFIGSRSKIWAREGNLPDANDPAAIIAIIEIAGMAFGVARLLLAKVEEVERLTNLLEVSEACNKAKTESTLILQAHADAMEKALQFYADPRKIQCDRDIPDFYDELCFGEIAQDALTAYRSKESERVDGSEKE